jgi:TolB-like protein/Tfp pilus assembly protein PilF
MGGGVAFIVLVIAALIWNFYFRHPPIETASVDRMAFPLPDRPSIAVLPFVNMSEDPKQEFFSDGMTEDIITALSKTPRLFVIARNSTFTYKGKPVNTRQVAEELGVRYVLEGSIRKSENKVRVTAQLIDALKGTHVWAEKYDRDLKEIFAIQDDITRQIIEALQVELTEGEQAKIWTRGTKNTKALEKAFESLEHFRRFNPDDVILCRKKAEEALALDPNYPFAVALLAWSHLVEVWNGWSESPGESMKKAVELGRKVLALDENYADAHALLGSIYLVQGKWDKAVEEGERAVELLPNGADVNGILGITYSFIGRPQEAISLVKKAIRLNPSAPNWLYHVMSRAQILVGDYQEAIISLERVIEKNPKHLPARIHLIAAYSLSNQDDEAKRQVEEFLKFRPNANIADYRKRSTYKNKADETLIMDALRNAGLPETPPLPLPDKPSIAVLPFENMSGDPEQEYFSNGLTEEIITALSKTPKLFVIARNSSFTYKGKPVWIPTVGKELGVKYVLEGTVRKAGDKVRVTAQLIDAQTNNHIWAERYDRDLKDIFAIQDDITMKIVTAMRVSLTDGEQARISAKGTDNLEAYLKCLKSHEYLLRMNREDNIRARKMAEEAIALDPGYARPYAILANTHQLDLWYRSTKSPKQSLAVAFKLAQEALRMDESLGYAHVVLSYIYLLKSHHEKALDEAEQALALEPNSALRHAALGRILIYDGRPEEAVPLLKRALRLSPIPEGFTLYTLGFAYNMTGRYEEAIEACRKAIGVEPENLWSHVVLTTAYSLAGREEEARAEAGEVLRINPKFSLEHFAKTMPFKNDTDKDPIITALHRAGLK